MDQVRKTQASTISYGRSEPRGARPTKVGSVTRAQLEEIAKIKMPDLNTNKLQSCMNTVMGTAANMGITVTD